QQGHGQVRVVRSGLACPAGHDDPCRLDRVPGIGMGQVMELRYALIRALADPILPTSPEIVDNLRLLYKINSRERGRAWHSKTLLRFLNGGFGQNSVIQPCSLAIDTSATSSIKSTNSNSSFSKKRFGSAQSRFQRSTLVRSTIFTITRQVDRR